MSTNDSVKEPKTSSERSEIASRLALWELRSGDTVSNSLLQSEIHPFSSAESETFKSQVSSRPFSEIAGGTPVPIPRTSPQRKASQKTPMKPVQEQKSRSPSCPSSVPQPERGHSSRLEFIAAPGARARTRSPVIEMVQNRITHQLQALSAATSSSLAARAAREERDKELEALRSRRATVYGTGEKSTSTDSKENRLTFLREGSNIDCSV